MEGKIYNQTLINPEFLRQGRKQELAATDHMFIAEYYENSWQTIGITRLQDISLSPFSLCFHYGQTVFEGMKAFRMKSGEVSIFRIDKHFKRFNASLKRMCMPEVPEELFYTSIIELVKTDRKFVPDDEEAALYIRPFMIASEPKMGLKISEEYLYMVVSGRMEKYYQNPMKVKVETGFVRAAEGGTGFAKCGGNYGGAFYPTALAKEEGFDQLIWTDSTTRSTIEESGTMNIVFIIDGKLITPPLSSTILDGVTRDSILTIAREMGYDVEERKISISEIEEAFKIDVRVEAFGVGTAAVVAPFRQIMINNTLYDCYHEPDAEMFRLKNELLLIRTGRKEDKWHWNTII